MSVMTRSRTGCGRRLLPGLPRRLEIRLAAPRARKSFNSRKTCRRLSRSRPQASRTVTRRASKSISTSSRENSLALIDTTVIQHVLLQPRKAGECHLNFAEGCHLYIALTNQFRGLGFMERGAGAGGGASREDGQLVRLRVVRNRRRLTRARNLHLDQTVLSGEHNQRQ